MLYGASIGSYFRALLCPLIVATLLPAKALAEGHTSNPPIKSGCEYDYPPFCIVSEDKQADGFSVELLREALKAVGRDVQFMVGPWPKVKQSLADGKIQALPLVGRTPEREAVFDFTFPYLVLHGTIVVRSDTTDIRSMADLKGRTVAVLKGDNAEEFLRRHNGDINIVTTNSFSDALKQLSEGRHDAVVIQKLLALRLIQQAGITNLKCVGKPLTEFQQSFCFAVKEGDKDSLALLNEGLSIVMADGTFRRLQRKWFAFAEQSEKRKIIVGGDYDYPPYEYLDDNGQPAGYNVELTRAIAKKLGLDVQVELGPWDQIRKRLETGDIDLIHGMFYSAERDKVFDFTPPHTVVDHVAVVRDGQTPPKTIEELRGKNIVVMKGDIMHEFALKNGLEKQLSLTETQEQALQELATGKHDCALVARLPALYWIKERNLTNLRVSDQPFLSPEYCYAAMPANSKLLARFGESLAALKETGEYHKLNKKWLGIYTPSKLSFGEAFRYAAIIVIPILILLMLSFLWSSILRRQVTERTKELDLKQAQYRRLAENVPAIVFQLKQYRDKALTFTYLSGTLQRQLGVSPSECMAIPSKLLDLINPEDRQRLDGALVKSAHELTTLRQQLRFEVQGNTKWFSMEATADRQDDGEVIWDGFLQDVTERRDLEDRMRQMAKMDAIGQLAGGVAHDFNNQLSGIMGYADVLERRITDDKLKSYAKNITTGSERAAALVKKLLAFAREGQYEPVTVDMNEIIGEVVSILAHTIDKRIETKLSLKAETPTVLGDPSQLQNCLLNMAINAADVMPTGGKLTFATGNTQLDEHDCKQLRAEIQPGKYLEVSVTDTGSGIPSENLNRVFEPFFTTKEVGKGTGMGLAVVYGAVKQHEGAVTVKSEPGKGTTFTMYLPTVEPEAPPQTVQRPQLVPAPRDATVLVIDDEEIVRNLTTDVLSPLGYTVVTCENGRKGLDYFQENWKTVDVVILDMIMPVMNGPETFRQMADIDPNLKVLIASGYSLNGVGKSLLKSGVKGFMQKPFNPAELTARIAAIIS